ncbi:sugar phosphate isomerase/epimerase family protein [Pelagicoccus mobilis]|uniref:TIM barrel protein n=1 Tax=Pelagicoccus mobilis TaxID=415221 RepID=A0A934RVZ7_9BACT|nr:TIM barrel protein [Pelagicoccus mobilis]MBK1878740.1 TIM barrel protein [Pelagicoccus mobilis]
MKLLYAKSHWEVFDRPVQEFLSRTKQDGFDGAEMFLPWLKESPSEIQKLVSDNGLFLIAQINSAGKTPQEHLDSFRKNFQLAVDSGAMMVNSHTGSDVFTFEQNIAIFEEAIQLSKQAGLTIAHETHRGRPTFSGPATRQLLEALPELELCTDFSHWFCVHESQLHDQEDTIKLACERARHVHARVGFEEGPQIPDPAAPEWSQIVDRHFELWQQIIDLSKERGAESLTITPEFGPPPYMPIEPHTQKPLADAWTVNTEFLKVLKQRLKA